MAGSQQIIITDASPLLTLAAANRLDLLLNAGSIIIPDAVKAEAADLRYPDGRLIDAWIEANRDRIEVPKTIAGAQREVILENGTAPKHFGELASFEVAQVRLGSDPQSNAVLIYEDKDVPKLAAKIDDPRIYIAPTAAYLLGLQQMGVIPSAHDILDKAHEAGRNMQMQFWNYRKRPSRHTLKASLPSGLSRLSRSRPSTSISAMSIQTV